MTRHDLLLGTAQWGWNTDSAAAFALLDAWLAAGCRRVDAATNYPINGQVADFRASERILLEYIAAHSLRDELAVTVKIGSMTNVRTPDNNLAPSFLRMVADEYRRTLGGHLAGLMIHWDHRADPTAIGSTLDLLAEWQREGLQVGLSGIAHPDVYAQVNAAGHRLDFDIQLKINVFQSDWDRYAPLREAGQHRFFAYGTNAGGVQLAGAYGPQSTLLARGGDPAFFEEKITRLRAALPKWNASVRPPVTTMPQLGLLHAWCHEGLSGVVLGPRHVDQLRTSLDWVATLEMFDYQDVARDVRRLMG
jgi:aryl-alcohol dehydrogenase-like predicted oxidoreductase